MNCRCAWVGEDPLYIEYHDREWGVPVRDPQRLFEFLLLEGAQAGLSWLTVLKVVAHRAEETCPLSRGLRGFRPRQGRAFR